LRGSRSLQNLRLTIKKQGEWFVAGGELSLDDGRVLALRELLQMAGSARGRFLQLGENDYLALTDSFRKRLDELRALGEAGADGIRLNALAAPALAELAAEAGEIEADAAWREQVNKLDALADFYPQVPSTLQAELRDYQLAGYQWLARFAHWGVGACLADDMGLGKTVQTLALVTGQSAGRACAGGGTDFGGDELAVRSHALCADAESACVSQSSFTGGSRAFRSGHCQLWHVAVGCRGFRCATLAQRGAG
jgi:hypothetical protein